VACLPVPRAKVFSCFLLFAWWPPLLFLVRRLNMGYEGTGYSDTRLPNCGRPNSMLARCVLFLRQRLLVWPAFPFSTDMCPPDMFPCVKIRFPSGCASC
jgi:hypothetical protein